MCQIEAGQVMGHFSQDALEKFRYQFIAFLAEHLRFLLETKHLYQKLSISPDDILAKLREGIARIVGEKEDFDSAAADFISGKFTITDRYLFQEPGHRRSRCLVVGNVKLFCSTCDAREAFRPIWFSDLTNSFNRTL